MRRVLAVLAAAVALAGCRNVYVVSDKANSGIPFFPLEAVDATTSVYEQRWYELELVTTWQRAVQNGKAVVPGAAGAFTTSVIRFTTSEEAARFLAAEFGLATSAAGAYDKVFPMMRDLATSKGKLDATEPATVGLSADLLAFPLVKRERRRQHVPSARPLYLNSTVPFGGKGNAVVELSENGTLTKATADVADELPGGVLALLGAATGSDAATAVLSRAVGVAEATQAKGESVIGAISLRLTPVRRLYAVTVAHDASTKDEECAPGKMLKSGSCHVNLVIEVRRGQERADAPPKSGADAITFSGSVELPKERSGK
jgi:hypothetical protein